jgi:hypothetical protein
MKISREQSENFMRSFSRVRGRAYDIPYMNAYRTYQRLLRGDAEGMTVDDLAIAVLAYASFVDTYFIASVDAGKIKIGKTTDLSSRFSTLQSGCPVELRLVLAFKFDDGLEGRLHEYLAAHRAGGEWFHASPEVISTIKSIRDQGADWVVDTLGEPCRHWADAARNNSAIGSIMLEDMYEQMRKIRLTAEKKAA